MSTPLAIQGGERGEGKDRVCIVGIRSNWVVYHNYCQRFEHYDHCQCMIIMFQHARLPDVQYAGWGNDCEWKWSQLWRNFGRRIYRMVRSVLHSGGYVMTAVFVNIAVALPIHLSGPSCGAAPHAIMLLPKPLRNNIIFLINIIQCVQRSPSGSVTCDE